jgi:orotate phosphoribosyltransferase
MLFPDSLRALLLPQYGHYLLESGHHGRLWMDLEALFLEPKRIEPMAETLAERLAPHHVEVVCGPLTEGAFLALMVAQKLAVPFTYSERYENSDAACLYPYGYRLPRALQRHVRGKRVAIVNDVINAGSAVRGTWIDLDACAAKPIAIGALLILGDWTSTFAAANELAVESIASLPNELWSPSDCPLCTAGAPLETRIQTT